MEKEFEINIFYARDIKAECPNCGEWLDGWIGNPQGKETECDYCGVLLKVNPDADVEFEY